jgi:SAM-dependent methyltransferase
MTDQTPTVAEQQRVYWNSPVGDKWVNNQSTLDAMFVPLTADLIELASIKAGEKILDVGCGGGTTTRILANKVGAQGQVLGVDISTPLLVAAKAQTTDAHVDFFEGDAGSAEVPMDDADLIISRFGVMFFADAAVAFAHMRKALKPTGRLCFVCWGPLENNPWFKMPLEVIATRLGLLDPIQPRAPGPLAFAQTDYIVEFLGQAEFDNITVETRNLQLNCNNDPAKVAEFLLEFGPGARILATQEIDTETRQQLVDELAKQVEAYMVADGVQIPANLHYVRAINSR